MGCWNGTCGVSQLPIMVGDKIRVFILKPSHGTGNFVTKPNNFVYTTDMFTVLGIPFVAEYNDYGSVESIEENYSTKIIHKALADMVVLPKDKPFSKGDSVKKLISDDSSHYFKIVDIQGDMVSITERHIAEPEIEIVSVSDIRHDNRQGFYDDIGNLEQTISLIERDVFEVDNKIWARYGLNKTAIPGLFYVRENVWQTLISDIDDEDNYSTISRKEILKQIDEFLVDLKKLVDKRQGSFTATEDLRDTDISELDKDNLLALASSVMSSLAFERCGGDRNRINGMFGRYSEGFDASLYKNVLVDLVRKNDIDSAKAMLIDIADTSRFINSMQYLRKPLIPQCGQGSQCTGEEYHTALNKVVATEIEVIRHQWDE